MALAFSSRGNAYYNKRDYDRAIQDLTQAVKLNPNDIPAFNDRGIAYGIKGEVDLAIEDFEQVIRLDPEERGRPEQPRLCLPQQGRYRPRHRRLRPGDQAQRQLCARLLQPRQRLL